MADVNMDGGTCNEREMLALQLSEIEILMSMFTEGKELCVDHGALAAVQDFLAGETFVKPNRISFAINLTLGDNSGGGDSVDVSCCLPQQYPRESPDVYVKSTSLTREIQKELNEATVAFLSGLERGELCILTLIQWLQEAWPEFHERSSRLTNCKAEKERKDEHSSDKKNLSRIWLYMHHIYSKTKRKHIIDWAEQGKLTGFSLPGKPGVVCVEGDSRDVEEYFSRLRKLNWRKITCRHKEESIMKTQFVDFKELVFHVPGTGDDRMSMGDFFQFLVKHELGEVFKILFGIDGRLNDGD